MSASPLVLCILDGLGEAPPAPDNAANGDHAPFLSYLDKHYPKTMLATSGQAVGLPEGQMGNSEVGHMTIGLGRILMQSLPRVSAAFADGSMQAHAEIQTCIRTLKANGGTLHVTGLLSEGGVHSHEDHLLAMADLFADQGVPVALHVFTDGRDVPPGSAGASLAKAAERIRARGDGRIRIDSVGGRYFGMDRDGRAERTLAAVAAMTGTDPDMPRFSDPAAYALERFKAGITDEFLPPARRENAPVPQDGDVLALMNFRADRMRQLTAVLASLSQWSRTFSLTEYDAAFNAFLTVLFPPDETHDGLGEIISRAGLRQLRTAETEKYAHVTFFLSGGREEPYPGEKRVLIPSPKVATYDLQPEMSASLVADAILAELDAHEVIIVNFANADMVGHTGSYEAAVKAVAAVDSALACVIPAVLARGGTALITADHGNAEQMRDPATGAPHTQHTLTPVPFRVVSPSGKETRLREAGTLADVAPTVLDLLGLPASPYMTGRSLIVK